MRLFTAVWLLFEFSSRKKKSVIHVGNDHWHTMMVNTHCITPTSILMAWVVERIFAAARERILVLFAERDSAISAESAKKGLI